MCIRDRSRVVVSETDGHEIHCFTDVEASKHNDLSEWHVDASGRESTRARSGAKPVVSIELDVLNINTAMEFNTVLALSRGVPVDKAREQKSSTLSRLTSAHRARDSLAVASVEREHDHTSAADKAPAANPMPPIDAGTCVVPAPPVAAIE